MFFFYIKHLKDGDKKNQASGGGPVFPGGIKLKMVDLSNQINNKGFLYLRTQTRLSDFLQTSQTFLAAPMEPFYPS